MNKRIRELAEQADAYADAMDIGGKNYIGLRDEYFAELIVRECIQVLDDCHVNIPNDADFGSDQIWVSTTLNSTVNFSMGKIKEHFGVKE